MPESNSGSGASGFPLKDEQSGTGGKGLIFAKFPTAEAGFKAQRDLWERKYSNMSIASALKFWAPDATENYGKGLEKIIGKSISSTKFSDLTEEQKVAFLNEQARQEGFFKSGSKPNRLNNPGALLFAETQRKFGGEPVQASPPAAAVASNKPSYHGPADEKDGIGNFLSGQNKYDKMSESELLIEIMGDMFGDVTKVLSGMMSNLSKGGPDRAAADASADVHDIHGTQMTQALQGRLFYSMTG